MRIFGWSGQIVLVFVFLVGMAIGNRPWSPDPGPEVTSITGTPGGGEILLRKGETPEPFCFIVGQVTTSGLSEGAAGRGRMFFARTCDEEMKWKR